MGLSVLFGGIKLQGLTRQMAELQKDRPHTSLAGKTIFLGSYAGLVMIF